MGRENKIVGRSGEMAASDFLRKRGYRILERNLRTPFGEIDLVAKDKKVTVFVEVKARTGYSLGPPYLSVTWRKKKRLIKNALFYLKKWGSVDSSWRIDVVSVNLNPVRNCSNSSDTKNISNGMNYRYEPEFIEIIENAVQGDDT